MLCETQEAFACFSVYLTLCPCCFQAMGSEANATYNVIHEVFDTSKNRKAYRDRLHKCVCAEVGFVQLLTLGFQGFRRVCALPGCVSVRPHVHRRYESTHARTHTRTQTSPHRASLQMVILTF